MSQLYDPVFNPDDEVQSTMEDVYSNSNTIRSKFSGTSSPASPVAHQWWANLTEDQLNIRDKTNTGWDSIWDFHLKRVVLKDGQVYSTIISDSTRKPSLVDNQDITPKSCTLKTPPGDVGGPQTPAMTALVGAKKSVGVPGGYQIMDQYRVYCSGTAGNIFKMTAQLRNCSAYFTIDVLTSPTSSVTTGWIPELSLDISSLTGWKTFTLKVQGTISGDSYLIGYSTRI